MMILVQYKHNDKINDYDYYCNNFNFITQYIPQLININCNLKYIAQIIDLSPVCNIK